MNIDTVLFIIGAAGLVILAVNILYFLSSSKKSKNFKRFIQEETYYITQKNTMLITDENENNRIPESTENNITISVSYYDKYTVIPHINSSTALNSPETDLEVITLLDEKNTEYLNYDNHSDSKQNHADNTNQMKFLDGLYTIEKEIYSGPMSKVFLARSIKLNNKCIIKFVTHDIGNISYEHEKLKNLYHISLPKIIDIFTDKNGMYIVQSYIEGQTLGKVINDVFDSKKVFNPHLIVDWAKQLCDVYSYLHNFPIYHFDIKPDNIMVTHGDRLVPIDFGISKHAKDDLKKITGISPKYAAPEQFKNLSNNEYKKLMDFRFGDLPEDYINWEPSAQTDIFSFGVVLFELAVGEIPNINNILKIKDAVSGEFAKIILKCIQIKPSERYQTMGEILTDLHKLNIEKVKIHRSMLMRKIAMVIIIISFVISGSSFVGGSYIYQQENLSIVDVTPQFITLSIQQSSELKIEKQTPNGDVVTLNPNVLSWSFDINNIVQIDGQRIVGLNRGQTAIKGKYRNKLINLIVNVVDPMDGIVDIVQIYKPGYKVKLYAGTLEREHIDGIINGEAEFVSPESIDIADNGTIYIADSGVLRIINNNIAESIDIEPFYMTPKIVRCYKNDVYILTSEWEENDGSYAYGIIKLADNNQAQKVYITDAVYTAIEDFGFINNVLYFIERNVGVEEVYLKTIDLQNSEDIYTLCKLPKGTKSLAFGENNAIYLANPETGIIQIYDGELRYFAGVENEKAFIDGNAPLFYMPQKIKYANNSLYIWDFNILRKLTIENGIAVNCMTFAGEASPEFDLEYIERESDAEAVILANSMLCDFAIIDGGVLLTDPKRGVIWQID